MDAIKTLKNLRAKTEIYETTNYELFEIVNGNRIVNCLNYTKLIKSIEEKQLLIPICVNEKMEIIDGQHRFMACKELRKPIYFYVAEGYTIEDVKRANLVSRTWSKLDFLNLYIIQNNENYLDFEELLSTYKLNMSDLLKVFAYVQDISNKDIGQLFDNGLFVSEGKELVRIFLDSLNDFKLFTKYLSKQFVGAFMKLYFHENYSHEKMKERLTKRSHKITVKATTDDYISMLTNDIYSFGAVKNPIYYDASTKKFY